MNLAEIEFTGPVSNAAAGGVVTGQNAVLRFNGGLNNAGELALAGGANQVTGEVANSGDLIVSGGAAATFHDDVINDGTLQVSEVGATTSVAVFLGTFTGTGGSTGGGDVFFEGDLRPGSSTATVTLENDVSFGPENSLHIELGGGAPGLQFDQIHVVGDLTLDGSLNVSLINGFAPFVGLSFDLLDWTTVSGAFSAINLPSIGPLHWNTSQLYTEGVISVAAAFEADFDEDGDVDGEDLDNWRDGFEVTLDMASHSDGDADGDHDVDGDDFLVWQRQLGGGGMISTAFAAVPEPGAFRFATYTMLAVLGVARCRRRRGRPDAGRAG
jgi:hypothetical protein